MTKSRGIRSTPSERFERRRNTPTPKRRRRGKKPVVGRPFKKKRGRKLETTPAEKKRIGSAIKKRRLLADMTQAQLAERAEAGRSTIAQIEAGNRVPGKDLARRLAKILRCKLADLGKKPTYS